MATCLIPQGGLQVQGRVTVFSLQSSQSRHGTQAGVWNLQKGRSLACNCLNSRRPGRVVGQHRTVQGTNQTVPTSNEARLASAAYTSAAVGLASLGLPSNPAFAAVERASAQGGKGQALDALWQLADLDPSTAKLLITILGPLFAVSTFLFIIRIIMSWYPQLPATKFPYVIAYAPTEPVLGPTRRLIPPIGGVDISPVIWLAFISFSNEVLLGQQGLLVLLAEKRLGSI